MSEQIDANKAARMCFAGMVWTRYCEIAHQHGLKMLLEGIEKGMPADPTAIMRRVVSELEAVYLASPFATDEERKAKQTQTVNPGAN